MITTSFTSEVMLGSRSRARARLVSGATARIVTRPGLALMISTIRSDRVPLGRSSLEALGCPGITQPIFTVNEHRCLTAFDGQGVGRTSVDRRVDTEAPREIKCVAGRDFGFGIAEYGGDRCELQTGLGLQEQERHGIVDPRICIEDDEVFLRIGPLQLLLAQPHRPANQVDFNRIAWADPVYVATVDWTTTFSRPRSRCCPPRWISGRPRRTSSR